MNKFCTNCGKELGGAKFCPDCGTPSDNKQDSTVTEKAKTDKSKLIIAGFLGAYLVLTVFKCMEFSTPILGNEYSLKFYDIFIAFFKLFEYTPSDIKTISILCFGIAAVAEAVLMTASVIGLIRIFSTKDPALPQMSLASSSAIILSAVVMLSTVIIKGMLNSVPDGGFLYSRNEISLSGATVFLLILGIIGTVVAAKLEHSSQKQGETASGKIAEENTNECELCGKKDVPVREVIINDEFWGELERYACDECIEKLDLEKAGKK